MLRNRTAERSIRKEARRRLRSSRELRREYRRARSDARRRRASVDRLVGYGFFLSAPVFMALSGMEPLGLGSVLLGIGSALLGAAYLKGSLASQQEIDLFAPLPMPDDEFAANQLRLVFRRSLKLLFIFVTAYVIVFAGVAGGLGIAIGVVAGLMQWVLAISAALIIAAWSTSLLGRAGCAAFVLVLAGILAPLGALHSEAIMRLSENSMLVAAPFYWVHTAASEALKGDTLALLALLVTATALIPATSAYRRLVSDYRMLPDSEPALDECPNEECGVPEISLDACEEIIFEESFAPWSWTRVCLLGRIIGMTLSKRDKVVAEFLLGAPKKWSRGWAMAAIAMPGAVLLAMQLSTEMTPLLVLLPIVGLTIASNSSWFDWPGLKMMPTAGAFSAMYAALPITYREVSSVLWKAGMVLTASLLPVAAGCGALFAWMADGPLQRAVLGGLGCATMATLCVPYLVVFVMMTRTADGQTVCRGALVLAVLLPFAIMSVIGLVLFAMTEPSSSWFMVILAHVLMGLGSFGALTAHRLTAKSSDLVRLQP